MGHSQVLHAYFVILFIIFSFVSITLASSSRPCDNYQTSKSKLCTNTTCLNTTSSDYGKIVHELPLAVLYPSSVSDVINLVKSSYKSSDPFSIAARGNGHSVRGQALAKDGVVVEMASLYSRRGGNENFGIRVYGNSSLGFYADVGGEQLWIDVLRTTIKHGLAPVSWTDYLYLSVGGTLSNAGISGQSSFYGPQISNVLEMDVITGKGNFITCSKNTNSDLFYSVLGGLGQFGIITRAKIVLHKAPYRVKRVRIIYEDFSKFTKDQEHLISIHGLDYLEGSLMMDISPSNNFYSFSDASKINSLIQSSKNAIFYTLEAVKYYYDHNINTIDEELELMFKGVSFTSDFIFKKDSSFFDFVNRLGNGEKERLEDIRHPWLNLFVPRSRITEFNQGVFVEILQKQGPYLVYPINRQKWDDRMSVVIPDDDEDMFYTVGLLHSTKDDHELTIIEEKNKKILEFCYKNEIKIKQYFPHYKKKEEWMKHFGKKWTVFEERKNQFDPKKILSPGQRIFRFN